MSERKQVCVQTEVTDVRVKRCAACQQDLPARAFTVNRRTKTGLSAYCRTCWNTKQRAYHSKWSKDPAFREKRRQKWQSWQQENKELLNVNARKYYSANRDEILQKARAKRQPVAYAPRPCDICGQTYTPKRSNSLTCGTPCRNRLNYLRSRDWRTDWMRKRRAARRGLLTEDFTLTDIADRDGWRCQICGHVVDPQLRWPHKQCATMDHIVPIKMDGEHSRANCQLAHADCNRRKGSTLREPVQLALALIG